MHGLAILFIILALYPISMIKASDGMSGSRIPLMRTGAYAPSPLDTFNRACRNMVSARIAQTISEEADPEKAARIASRIHTFIPSEEFEANKQENPESILPRIQAAAIQIIKPKLSPSLRYTVPEQLLLLSGFTPSDQDPLTTAGCYIRLGNNLRHFGLVSLAATSFLNSGVAFARTALLFSRCTEEVANQSLSTDTSSSSTQEEIAEQVADLMKSRVDMLMSVAQSYYWAYCNEDNVDRKATIKTLTQQYFARASADVPLLSTTEQLIWIAKIAREQAIFLAHSA